MLKRLFGVKKVYKVGYFNYNGKAIDQKIYFLDEDSYIFADIKTAMHHIVDRGYKLLRKPIEVNGIKLIAIRRTNEYGVQFDTYAGIVSRDIEGL